MGKGQEMGIMREGGQGEGSMEVRVQWGGCQGKWVKGSPAKGRGQEEGSRVRVNGWVQWK